MSTALGLLTIVKALDGAEEYLGQGQLSWTAVNEEQRNLLGLLSGIRTALPLIPTLQGWARPTADELNQILAEHRFDIRLNPWPGGGNSFGVVAINDFTVNWVEAGATEETWGRKIDVKGRPAFRLDRSAGVTYWQTGSRSEPPVVKIPTKTGDIMHIVRHDRAVNGFALLGRINELRGQLTSARPVSYEGVVIPMMSMRLRVNIDWLKNLWAQAGADRVWIEQALQEVQFAMNQYGARVREATAIEVMRGMPEYVVIDGPAIVWIERPGVPVPLFMAHMTEEHWADPGDLSAF